MPKSKKHVTAKSNSGVRISSLKVTTPHWGERYVHIDDEGDVYVSDKQAGAADTNSVMVERSMMPAMIRALKIASDT